MKNDLE